MRMDYTMQNIYYNCVMKVQYEWPKLNTHKEASCSCKL